MKSRSLPEKLIVLTLAGLLFLHLAVCFLVVIFPGLTIFGNRKLTAYYKYYAVPGPFFREDLIRSVPHFLISYKTKSGNWTGWTNPELNNFRDYHEQGWRYDKLKQSKFEHFLAKSLARKISEKDKGDYSGSTEFKELHHYLADRYLTADTDSVAFVYVTTQFNPETKNVTMDTMFHIQYKLF